MTRSWMIVRFAATFRRPRNLGIAAVTVVLCAATAVWADPAVFSWLVVLIGLTGSAFVDPVYRDGGGRAGHGAGPRPGGGDTSP
ncbi:hypothetical protein [Streptosporangium sp. NBC_01469]|uniref:hypothetical protein n=1 Tax=Streptosporangium sp. NBC_01469 TaxID=2903898 RepID=UPI002E2BECF9|nr:hypothetical protein [Streptosporangium sp. NBC_01469]